MRVKPVDQSLASDVERDDTQSLAKPKSDDLDYNLKDAGVDSVAKDWHADATLPAYHLAELFDIDAIRALEACIDDCTTELRDLSVKIHDHPETAYNEHYAHQLLTGFMTNNGFEVTPHFAGLATAWQAKWTQGEGGRTIGFNSEMDALPGIGHACGHNLIAIGGVAAALGVRAALEKSGKPGTVILLGTPAEEKGSGKIQLIKRGAYKSMDACLMLHPSAGPVPRAHVGSTLAVQQVTVEYHGKTAHASAAPWEGQNALDAAFLAYSAVSALRQQIKPTHRVHGTISGKDWAPNIIPDYSKLTYLIRAPTADEAIALAERVKKCFEAGTVATECTMKITEPEPTMYDLRQNLALAEEFRSALGHYGYTTSIGEGFGASTDFGNVTYELPALHPGYTIPSIPNGGNHTRAFADAARTEKAHEITLNIAKGIAIAGLRVVLDDGFFARVKNAYDVEFGKH